MSTFLHFAYGSNLSLDRIRSRCRSALPESVGFVQQRQLRFHKIGRDGTGKADAFWTGQTSDCVWGVVYRCLLEEQPILDRAESLGVGYEQVGVEVHTKTGTIETFLYQAKSERIDANLSPAAWYHLHVVNGAREHSLPLKYQRMIANYDE